MLRYKSLHALLELNGYHRRSLKSLKSDFAELYIQLKSAYQEVEAYEMLAQLETNADLIDETYQIWIRADLDLPLVIEIMTVYSEAHCFVLSKKCEIPLKDFVEVAEATR
ncbi:MAG: hypothetical protein ACRC3B_12825 [Bacteroidia bacterium]